MEKKFVKYPIGIQDFEKLITEGFLYVDKTAILYDLIKRGNYIFLSRPRRFGKSLTLSTLKAYFEGKKHLFEGLAIYDLEKEWKKHPVFLLSFARFTKDKEDSMDLLLEFHLSNWEKEYGISSNNQNFENRFAALIKKAHETTGERAVVLVDEYDSGLVSTLEKPELHNKIKNLLKPFYTVLKDFDSHIKFVLITGITRFSKLTIFSGFNNLSDISLDNQYSAICGITEKELETNFHEGIISLSKIYNLDYEGMLEKLKGYYDGYHFTAVSEDIYNPFSILNALARELITNYWFSTGVPSYLVERMHTQDLNLEKYMNQTANGETLQETDSAYTSDLAILFQAGFLTIKGFDYDENLYQLGIPNLEVKDGMSKLFMEKYLYPNKNEGQNLLLEITRSMKAGEPDKFLKLLKGFFAGVPFDLSKGDKEIYFHNAFYIVTNLIGLQVQAERHTSVGSIDLVITTPNYVYVIEIKLNKRPQIALDQIHSKDYALQWESGDRKVFKIGVSFSSRTRTIGSWIIE